MLAEFLHPRLLLRYIDKVDLKAGDHSLTIAYREDGALLDKIGITTYVYGPSELGDEAINICNP